MPSLFAASPSNVRVVWIIFDELAQSIAFERRPSNLQLPSLDRLKSECFYASSAHAPDVVTEKSIPGLILGEKVLDDIHDGPDALILRTPSRPDGFSWSSARNIFDRARDLGFNTALAGWYHPYGRLLNRSLTKCYWTPIRLNAGIEEPFHPRALWKEMWDRATLQFSTLPLIGHVPGLSPIVAERRLKIEKFAFLRDRAIELVVDPSIGLVLLHLPVPHPPAIYDRSTRALATHGNIGYFDNVALADETLGILRRRMEQAGVWERSAVLVSADHGWRTNVWRGGPDWNASEEAASGEDTSGVPFLLKLPGRQTGLAYDKRFDTLVTQSLILDILRGTLRDAAAIPGLIERPN